MSATDELRRMLDECGVEWMPIAWNPKRETFYHAANGVGFCADEYTDGIKIYTDATITPAQAIAATLGDGACHLKPWEMERDTGFYDCMECDCGYVADVADWASWHFCPSCGRQNVGRESA